MLVKKIDLTVLMIIPYTTILKHPRILFKVSKLTTCQSVPQIHNRDFYNKNNTYKYITFYYISRYWRTSETGKLRMCVCKVFVQKYILYNCSHLSVVIVSFHFLNTLQNNFSAYLTLWLIQCLTISCRQTYRILYFILYSRLNNFGFHMTFRRFCF